MMKDQERNYYLANPDRRGSDFRLGFFIAIVPIIFGFFLVNIDSGNWNFVYQIALISLAIDVITLIFSKKRYVKLGVLSLVTFVLLIPGACFATVYGGIGIAGLGYSGGGEAAYINAAILLSLVGLIAGFVISIVVSKKILKHTDEEIGMAQPENNVPLIEIIKEEVKDETPTNSVN